jgi:selenocysteine lyase/cysteine desulfurase
MTTRRDFLSAGITSLVGARVAGAAGPGQGADQYLLAPGLVYLNTASTGPSTQAVLDRTIAAWRQLESNPVHEAYGLDALLGDAEKVREQAAAFLGCAADELMITRSTSEGMNTIAQSLRLSAGDRVVMTDQEHEGGTECWNYLAERRGVAVDKAAITPEMDDRAVAAAITAAITPATKVISVSHVLWTTGRRLPVAEIAAMARARGVLCVVDGAQAAGGIPVNVKAIGCHAYATTGHKWMLGPKGLGLLYISADAADAIKPVQWMATKRFVGPSVGVGPLAAVMGLGVALDAARTAGLANIERHNVDLRNRAYSEFKAMTRVRLMSGAPGSSSISALISVELPKGIVPSQFIRALFDRHQVQVKAIARPFAGIRLSPHVFNTNADIDKALAAIRQELGA